MTIFEKVVRRFPIAISLTECQDLSAAAAIDRAAAWLRRGMKFHFVGI